MQSIYVRLMIYGFMGIWDLAGSRPRGSGSIPGAKELRTRGGAGGGDVWGKTTLIHTHMGVSEN